MIFLIYILKLLVLKNVFGEIIHQQCRALNNICTDDRDCCSNRCVYSDESSTLICKTGDVNLMNYATALKNLDAPEKCVLDGHSCLADVDCCSKQCYNLRGTTFRYCVQTESINGPMKIEDKSASRKKCIAAEKVCHRDAECCSKSCRIIGLSIHRKCAA